MMVDIRYPVIDLPATGENILRMRESRGFSVRDLQQFFGFDAPQAIYKWQRGQTLPSVDNLFALAALFRVPIDAILVPMPDPGLICNEQQASACCSAFLNRLLRIRRVPFHPSTIWSVVEAVLPSAA
ncbi:MAG: helix-turn-helix transcriptional regulator [Oscillospiraceae bacterium]|nr:helix-turn-helix transcriptional regulator [Oscillospiraceae bacterium]